MCCCRRRYNTVWYENKKLRVKLARLSSQLNTTNGNLESVIQSTVRTLARESRRN